ncbi:hypothetical protein ISF_03543 [Cordyceps fumosorosea ARSEF 2679]|uniref:Mss4-like protein n=1 Tax=Cordyceps fumosorosea (strain ARSEF 2679) TaxID=1081104 RepID=A0A167ZD51_CORFA|nr:hypothetical protein ISF_03543 [Cordyceps fumosorosea ARSEF 2679]OAA67367.1 hypothetical protein ISF_03543 [Cordyceps fumosorosea ARSEF 2679]
MSLMRPLRGACQCGRNRYLIHVPEDALQEAQVLFNTNASHQASLATPLAAYIRVPLTWYRSATYAYCDDETHATIRRSYVHPHQQDCIRYFCGYCGTQLSYWSESPAAEAEYIYLTLGSLLSEDLHDLQSLGLIPDDTDSDDDTPQEENVAGHKPPEEPPAEATVMFRESFGVPWFEELVDGTRLGKLRHSSQDGQVRVEWEIIECSDNDNDMEDVDMPAPSPGKRKLDQRGDDNVET